MPKHPPVDFKSTKPFTTIPPIVREYTQEGIRYYLCEGGRLFIADTYDLNFTFKKGKVKPKHYREGEIGKTAQLKGLPSNFKNIKKKL